MLRILQSDYDLIHREAERSYPNECCGSILGTSGADGARRASVVIPCTNVRAEALVTAYQISPEDVVAALHEARTRGEMILGFYPSHPVQPAVYSATDLEEA